jgi:hypothetical protein
VLAQFERAGQGSHFIPSMDPDGPFQER